MTQAAHQIEPGDLIEGRYEIKKSLGQGGFAKVFLAFDKVIEREVAIKFLELHSVHMGNEAAHIVWIDHRAGSSCPSPSGMSCPNGDVFYRRIR